MYDSVFSAKKIAWKKGKLPVWASFRFEENLYKPENSVPSQSDQHWQNWTNFVKNWSFLVFSCFDQNRLNSIAKSCCESNFDKSRMLKPIFMKIRLILKFLAKCFWQISLLNVWFTFPHCADFSFYRNRFWTGFIFDYLFSPLGRTRQITTLKVKKYL